MPGPDTHAIVDPSVTQILLVNVTAYCRSLTWKPFGDSIAELVLQDGIFIVGDATEDAQPSDLPTMVCSNSLMYVHPILKGGVRVSCV